MDLIISRENFLQWDDFFQVSSYNNLLWCQTEFLQIQEHTDRKQNEFFRAQSWSTLGMAVWQFCATEESVKPAHGNGTKGKLHWLFLASAEVWGGQGLDLEKAGAGRGERRPFLGTSGWGVGLGPQLCHTDSSISSQPKAAFGLRGDLNLSRPFGAVLPYLGEGGSILSPAVVQQQSWNMHWIQHRLSQPSWSTVS